MLGVMLRMLSLRLELRSWNKIQPQNDSHSEEAVIIPESVAIQLKQQMPVVKRSLRDQQIILYQGNSI